MPKAPDLKPRSRRRPGPRKSGVGDPPSAVAKAGSRAPVLVVGLSVCLFLSGVSALAFQVAWFRELRLVFGASTAANAAVLAIFMGGLGLGSAVLGKLADRIESPVRLYAVLEVLIALAAAASPFLIGWIGSVYVAMGGQSALGLFGAWAVRLALSAIVLGVPTFLMGGTLPAAARAVTSSEDRNRRVVGFMYGTNTIGAVCGVVACTFWLLPAVGTRTSLWVACLLNLVVAAMAFGLARRFASARCGQPAYGSTEAPVPAAHVSTRSAPLWLLYASAATVGFVFFLMELVWYRMFAPILGGTTYTFGIILAVALAGIGLGGALYPALFRRIRPDALTLALTCVLEAVCVGFPYWLGDQLALWTLRIQQAATGFTETSLGWAAIAAIAVFPAAFISGLQFPLLVALVGSGRERVGREVGVTAAFNTLGAIAGSLAGGFGLLPLLTAPGAWKAAALVLVALGFLWTLLWFQKARSRLWAIAPFAGIATAVFLLVADGPTAAWRHSAIGAGRTEPPEARPNEVKRWQNDRRRKIVWEAEGVEASVAIEVSGGISFWINGKCDGHAVGDVGTQMMLGLLPAALHPAPKTAFVVGLGTGETAGWLAEVEGIERVDVAELEPAVNEMARRCALVNHNVLEHPRVRCVYNDAREILLTSSRRYDVISSEPSNPYRAGIASLFTREFYESARSRLTEDGIFTQWLQGYEVDRATVGSVIATLKAVFPHVQVWQSKSNDMLLVCSITPLEHEASTLRARIATEPYRSALAAGWRVVDLEGFLSRFVAGEEAASRWVSDTGGQLNTDDLNLIEYGFARTLGRATDFDVAVLRETAIACGSHRPAVAGDVDWRRVEGHRQIMRAITESKLTMPPEPTAEQKTRSRVLTHYLRSDLAEATGAWEQSLYEPLHPTETTLLALSYAHQGSVKADPLIERVAGFSETEARALRAYLHWRRGEIQDATAELEAFLLGARRNPWFFSHLNDVVFDVAVGLAVRDPRTARRLYETLDRSFAVWHCEGQRLNALCTIAEMLGPAEAAHCAELFEPHVPWMEPFLRYRSRAYSATNHPLKRRAELELEEFLRNQLAE